MMTLRFFTSIVCAYLFVKDLTGADLPALFAAASWAFCDFLVFFAGYPCPRRSGRSLSSCWDV